MPLRLLEKKKWWWWTWGIRRHSGYSLVFVALYFVYSISLLIDCRGSFDIVIVVLQRALCFCIQLPTLSPHVASHRDRPIICLSGSWGRKGTNGSACWTGWMTVDICLGCSDPRSHSYGLSICTHFQTIVRSFEQAVSSDWDTVTQLALNQN